MERVRNRPGGKILSAHHKGPHSAEARNRELGAPGRGRETGHSERDMKRKRREQRLDAELQFHFERQVADNILAGMAPEEALRNARLQFGGMEQIKEDCR